MPSRKSNKKRSPRSKQNRMKGGARTGAAGGVASRVDSSDDSSSDIYKNNVEEKLPDIDDDDNAKCFLLKDDRADGKNIKKKYTKKCPDGEKPVFRYYTRRDVHGSKNKNKLSRRLTCLPEPEEDCDAENQRVRLVKKNEKGRNTYRYDAVEIKCIDPESDDSADGNDAARLDEKRGGHYGGPLLDDSGSLSRGRRKNKKKKKITRRSAVKAMRVRMRGDASRVAAVAREGEEADVAGRGEERGGEEAGVAGGGEERGGEGGGGGEEAAVAREGGEADVAGGGEGGADAVDLPIPPEEESNVDLPIPPEEESDVEESDVNLPIPPEDPGDE